VVQLERTLRRADAGTPEAELPSHHRLVARLRELAPRPLAAKGEEFALVLARRTVDGEVVLLGEVSDRTMLERAARKLLA